MRVVSRKSDMISLAINYTEFDNSDLNTAAAIYASSGLSGPNGKNETNTITLENRSGVEKITAFVSNFR